MPSRLEIIEADITTLDVDAIVNAANTLLRRGGGVDNAIHEAAGPKLQEECLLQAPCPVGEVRITRGYDLPANYVIHAVGPKWGGGEHDEDKFLSQCYVNALDLTSTFNIVSIAFPSISTGAYGFPKNRAALIAMSEVMKFLRSNKKVERLVLCCFDEEMARHYEAAFDELGGQ